MFTLALLTGGPGPERGISLNSARSVLDHLGSPTLAIAPYYVTQKKEFYRLSPGQLYSNTPSDFDFKLATHGTKLTQAELVKELKKCDMVFPTMHGSYGEDGEVQAFLAKNSIPFVGSSAAACRQCFDKHIANEYIASHGFATLPSMVVTHGEADAGTRIRAFWKTHGITRGIVKPATGGSSIGVFSVGTAADAADKAAHLLSSGLDTRVVIEPFAMGKEFTVIIVQNRFGLPVAFIPTEIEADYTEHQIFDYRKKYLPTRAVTYHCPPRFSGAVIHHIQTQAQQLFALFGMADFARFDGFVLDDGRIWFSDFNPISGMEQNSFLFQQSARVGLSHREVLRIILQRACQRQGIALPTQKITRKAAPSKKPLAVLFGGTTSERQVSLMSGTNVWLKLLRSDTYAPTPYLMEDAEHIWRVPYALLLNHTVDEILDSCQSAAADEERLQRRAERVRLELSVPDISTEPFFVPERMSMEAFLASQEYVFIALHGGIGEDGTLQRMLEEHTIAYNGPGSTASALCMDKFETGLRLAPLADAGILVARKVSAATHELLHMDTAEVSAFWYEIVQRVGDTHGIIVKPRSDGCSSGIVRMQTEQDLRTYLDLLRVHAPHIPASTFPGQDTAVELPLPAPAQLLFEEYIPTDRIRIHGHQLAVTEHSGWLEMTVGVLEHRGTLHALPPSITVAESAVLTVEEKFQGGTGVNITPPPAIVMAPAKIRAAQKRIEQAATALGIRGYSRIDAFVERSTGRVMIIEANTLPALTPSTVLYHQGIASHPSILPLALLERIVGG